MNLARDFHYALRTFRRSPSLSAIIILTLALCIGANTAIFSVIDATLLRPLPYPEPERLVNVATFYRSSGREGTNAGQNGAAWELVRDHATYLDAAAIGSTDGANFGSAGAAQYIQAQRVGAGFFRILGVQPLIGREFTREDDRAGGPPVTVLSFAFWRRAFRSDPSIVGKSVMLSGEPYTVIGIMPESFHANDAADLWTPLRPSTTGEGSGVNYSIVARLKPGVTWAQADSQIEAVGAQMIREWKLPPGQYARFKLITLQQGQTDYVKKPLLIVWAAVGLVLLIGCANVTSLLLARAATRSREIATRLAIGGGRAAIVRQFLIETLVLAVAGSVAGLAVGQWGIKALKDLGGGSFPIPESLGLDARVLAATGLFSLLATLLAGIFPAIEASGVDIRTTLTEAGARGVAGFRKRWSRRFLVSGEVALAVLLLIGAGLLIRTLSHLYRLRPGFDPANVITARFSLHDARYAKGEKVNELYDAGLSRIRELPGVESAAVALTLPYERALNVLFERMDGPEAGSEILVTDEVYGTPDFLRTLRIPLLRGRDIRAGDGPKAALVALVNEAFVKKYLSRQEPVGSHIKLDGEAREVIGVSGNVQQRSGWGNFGPLAVTPTAYVPVAQMSGDFTTLHTWFPPKWIVRVNGSPDQVMRGIQKITATLDPLLPIAAFRTIDQLRSQALSEQRFQAALLGTLSGLALVLAIVGIYGLMAQSVVERRRELGIRLALGSSISRTIRDAALPGITLAGVGVAAGCLLAVLSTRVLEHLVWGVSTTDALTFTGVALGLLFIAAVACFIPALRITSLNPADTLREE